MELLAQAQFLEQSENFQQAEQLYRCIIECAPADEAGYVGLVHVLAKQNLGCSFVDIYRDELPILESAYGVGIWLPEIVLPLASLYWKHLVERERGILLVEQYLRKESDINRVREVLFCTTDELFSLIPPQHASILRLHATFQNESPIALTPYDQIYPFLTGAPGDLQNSYFALQRSDEWFATVHRLWSRIDRSQRKQLRPSYLNLTARGYQKVGNHEEAIATGRKYLRFIREGLCEPFRSSKLAQKYADMMAPSYLALGRLRQVTQAFQITRGPRIPFFHRKPP